MHTPLSRGEKPPNGRVAAENTSPKVDRTCPKCKARDQHLANYKQTKHQICCVSCGHVWKGRILWDDLI